MKLYEYQGKILFSRYGIRTPSGFVAASRGGGANEASEIKFPVMVKAQVLAGGRGKAGGVVSAADRPELDAALDRLLDAELKGTRVASVLVEEKVDFEEEYYLAVTLDSSSRMPVVIFSPNGGMDIEEIAARHPERITKILIDPLIGPQDFHLSLLFINHGITDTELKNRLKETIFALYAIYNEYDAMLVEINPLMRRADNSLVAADAKVEIDDSALYRHADLLEWYRSMDADPLEKKAKDLRFLYIDVNPDGNIAIISNGSGMIMSCADWIAKAGGKVVCALDLGGGATSERVAQGIDIMLQNRNVKSILISIFGGITRCDEIAGGIVKAVTDMNISVPIVAKLDGTNKEKGMEILKAARKGSLVIADGVRDAAEKVLSAQRP